MPYDPSKPIKTKVELQINGVWTVVTGRGRAAGNVRVKQGQTPGAIQPETSSCQVTLGNDDGYLTEGNPMSPWYPYVGRGTPIRVSLTGILVGDAYLFAGEIDEMVAVYPGGSSSSMEIFAVGAWGVLAQNDEAPQSPMRRTLRAEPNLQAYWPLEDGAETAGFTYSALPGGAALSAAGIVRFGAVNDVIGSLPMPNMIGSASLPNPAGQIGYLTGPVSMTATGSWTVQALISSTIQTDFQEWPILEWTTTAGATWRLARTETTNVRLFRNDVEIDAIVFSNLADLNGKHIVQVTAATSGSDLVYRITFDNVQKTTGTLVGSAVGAVTSLTARAVKFGGPTTDTNIGGLGHLAVFSDVHSAAPAVSASNAWAGELAQDRILRVCREAGVPITVFVGDGTVLTWP